MPDCCLQAVQKPAELVDCSLEDVVAQKKSWSAMVVAAEVGQKNLEERKSVVVEGQRTMSADVQPEVDELELHLKQLESLLLVYALAAFAELVLC